VQTHCGFIPENPNDVCQRNHNSNAGSCRLLQSATTRNFRYETGQETPITLIRAINDVVWTTRRQFRSANLMCMAKQSVDAIEILAPTFKASMQRWSLAYQPERSRVEVPMGKARLDFPRIIIRLNELTYGGAVTIERKFPGHNSWKRSSCQGLLAGADR